MARKKRRRYYRPRYWRGGYKSYLNTEHWFRKRRAFLRRFPECFVCNDTENCQVHHKTYINIGREPDRDLVTLCWGCHFLLHQYNLPQRNGHILLKEHFSTGNPLPDFGPPKKRSRQGDVTKYRIDPSLLKGKSGNELNDLIDKLKEEHIE